MNGAVPTFLDEAQAAQIHLEVHAREADIEAALFANDLMELDREIVRETIGGRLRASLVVFALVAMGVVLYAGHAWGGGVAMAKPEHFDIGPAAILAGGMTWSQLDKMAKEDAARSIGGDYPKLVRQLLRKYSELVRDTAHLRQPDLFAPSQMTAKKEERNGV